MIEVSCSDIDFYQRKIARLGEDNVMLHEELANVRSRLRTAQDYEIRYELLMQSSNDEIQRLRSGQAKAEEARREEYVAAKLRENNEKWRVEMLQLEENIKKAAQEELKTVQANLNEANERLSDLKKKGEEIELFHFKMKRFQKENQDLRDQLDEMKLFYEKQKHDELTTLKQHLTTTYREKMSNQRSSYESKIVNIEKRMNELQTEKEQISFQPPTTNSQLHTLQQQLEEKEKEQKNQLSQLKQLLQSKNEQIRQMLLERAESEDKNRQELALKRQIIEQLQERLLKREKQHEMEIFNLIERNESIKQEEFKQFKEQIHKLQEDLAKEHSILEERAYDHDREMESLNRKLEEEKKRLIEEKNTHKRKISELSNKMREAEGEREMGDTQMLINSLRDMEGREEQMGSYQNGITFLQRQLKKCQLKLEERSRTVSKLYKDINDIRAETESQTAELKQKARKQKKQFTEHILNLEHEVRNLNDKLRNKEREDRKHQREVYNQKLELEEQNKALRQLVEELQRDYNRVIQNKKGVESSYREEREKSFTSQGNVNLVKKQKWLELQKQKNELQIIFREKEEQLKLKYEQEVDDLTNSNNQLKQKLDVSSKENELLKKEVTQLQSQLESNKENDKYAEYNKKLATLNLEIALTQDIYESLLKAKSKHPMESPGNSLAQIDIKSQANSKDEDRQPLLMSFHPSANKMI